MDCLKIIFVVSDFTLFIFRIRYIHICIQTKHIQSFAFIIIIIIYNFFLFKIFPTFSIRFEFNAAGFSGISIFLESSARF